MRAKIMDRRMGLALARKLVRDSAQESDRRGVEVQQKREQRRARQAQEPPPALPDFDCVGEPKQRVPNAADVERWWCEAMGAAFDGRVRHERWTVHQMTLAKKLLALYGAEEVRRGLAETLATWSQHPAVVERRLGEIPTINLLWGMRETIWGIPRAAVERSEQSGLVKKKKGGRIGDREAKRQERLATGEWNPKEKDPKKRKGIGW
jgi:hypothetical protein